MFPQNWQTFTKGKLLRCVCWVAPPNKQTSHEAKKIPVIRIVTALLSLLGGPQKESIDIRWSQHNGRHKSDCFVGLDWPKSVSVLFVLPKFVIGCSEYWIKNWCVFPEYSECLCITSKRGAKVASTLSSTTSNQGLNDILSNFWMMQIKIPGKSPTKAKSEWLH